MVSQLVTPALAGQEIAFLHRLDGVTGETIRVITDRRQLAAASFLDGREEFGRDPILAPLDLRLPVGVVPARRFIFHVGFAGSTLLARLLNRPGHVTVLKEPQCLADVAGQREALVAGRGAAKLDALLDYALAELGRAGDEDVPVVVKPTNWVNSLLPVLCARGRIGRAIFVSMKRREFLGAAFRGGKDRLAFCARLASQIAPVAPHGNARLRAAIAADGDSFGRMARIVALLHWLQEELFAQAIAQNGWPDSVRFDFAEITGTPAEAVRRAQEHLALPVEPCEPEYAQLMMQRYTKDPSSVFQSDGRAREDREVAERYGACFASALAWLDAEVGAKA